MIDKYVIDESQLEDTAPDTRRFDEREIVKMMLFILSFPNSPLTMKLIRTDAWHQRKS